MRERNKVFALLITLTLCVSLLSGCGSKHKSHEAKTGLSAAELLACIYQEEPIKDEFYCYLSDTDEKNGFFLRFLDFDDKVIEKIKEYAIVKPETAISNEYLIFKTDDVDAIYNAVEKYRKDRISTFTGYAPKEEAKLHNTEVLKTGNCVAFLVGDKGNKLDEVFKQVSAEGYELTDAEKSSHDVLVKMTSSNEENQEKDEDAEARVNPDALPEGPRAGTKVRPDGTVLCREDAHMMRFTDCTPIIEAYKSGDDSKLSSQEKEVLIKVKQVMEENIGSNMTEYEKEKAIHDYIINNADYDNMALMYGEWFTEYADQPYGVLINKQSICVGYATTFKLFMDLLEIENVIVSGWAASRDDLHAWNLVKLDDGNWYAVDVSWDDPNVEESVSYYYFNVDDQVMSAAHHWNNEGYPSATGGKYSNLENN